MKPPHSMRALEELGRVRLSRNFFMRDFLYSEIANFYRIQNIPDDPDLAIMAGRKLCEEALEPLWERFGRISVGLRADLGAFEGDPSVSIEALRKPVFVMKEGAIYRIP